MILTISLDDGTVRKQAEEDDETVFDDAVVCLKVEGDKAFELDRDNEWNEVK